MRFRWTPARNASLTAAYRSRCPDGPRILSRQEWDGIGVLVGTSGKACGIQASRLGLTKSHTFVNTNRGTRSPADTSEGAAVPPQGQANGDLTHVSPLGPSARSEAEMLALFQVDVTRWEVVKLSHNVWEVGQKGPDGEPVVQPLCQTTLTCRRIPGAESLVALRDGILADWREAAPPRGPFVIKRTREEYLGEFCAPDKHYGKLGWSVETESSDYDLTIARERFKDAASDLFARTAGFKFSGILIPAANDEQHTDNLRSETTSGTRVDSDSRYHKMFRASVEDRIWMMREALQRAPWAREITVPGNHAKLGEFMAGEVTRAYFTNEPRAQFDNEPPLRKYFRWGKTLLAYTHGSEEKHSDLPLIMAQERPQDWAETIYRLWRIGHFHKRRQTKFTAGDSFTGVEVRIIASLSGTDGWHYSKGYVKQRPAMEAFVHHIEEGEVGAFISRLPQT